MSSSTAAEIQRVENGLGPAVIVKGEPVATHSLAAAMQAHHVPALSVAVMRHGVLLWAKGYGVTREGGPPVTPDTLFQAASISKSVTASAALHLVQEGKLSLDAPIQTELKSWTLPAGKQSPEHPVTLRKLLSHTAGTNVHGFPGYASTAPVPTLTQVLDGTKPANTEAIRVINTPDEAFSYSGGGFTIVQQVLIDATGEPFPKSLHDVVLAPARMTHSSFQQPLPPAELANVAMPVDDHGNPGFCERAERHLHAPALILGGGWADLEAPSPTTPRRSNLYPIPCMQILFVGDVFGSAGRRIVHEHLPHLLDTHAVDLLVLNGENAAGGFGITPSLADEFFDMGVHVITTGNHFWDKKEIFDYLAVPPDSHERGRRLLRPANFAVGSPGFGVYEGTLDDGTAYAVVNLQGRVFMHSVDDPFRKADDLLNQVRESSGAKVVLVDFHAEATSEKVALGWYLDGRVTAVLGTHTHIPTADERILLNGTAYQTDVGMSGPYDSVIGVETELVVKRFLTGMPGKFEAAKGNPKLAATLITCDALTGRAHAIRRFLLGE